MEIEIPGAGMAPQRASLEEELSAIFNAVLADERSAMDAVVEVHNVCQLRTEMYRSDASNQLHRPARHMALKALAEEMEAQAATWQLLFCLYCDEGAPAGEGGANLLRAGGAQLYRQRQADRVQVDKDLARCARVVSWLESLAEEGLRRQGGAAFAPGEGLWHETRTDMRSGPGSVVSELDPDAPGRTGRSLHPSNARSQERVLARVWQLLRAGQMPMALELCQQVGQPWRAAALGGGGPYGFLPVGVSAAQQDEQVGPELQIEELADEVANGSGTLLALWRWAALQAAAAPPGDKYERAVFGAVGGSTAAQAPACAAWEDFTWSFCRSWLESQVLQAVPPEHHAPADLVAGGAVTAALVRCGVPAAAAQRSIEGAMSIVLGNAGGGAAGAATAAPAPFDADSVAASASASSRGFGQLFAQHVMTRESLVQSGGLAVQALRQVQGLLIQGDMHALVGHLFGALVERSGGGGGGRSEGGAGAGSSGGAAEDGTGGGGGLAAANPERRWRTCALMVHMLLALEGLGVLTAGDHAAMGDGAAPQVQLDPVEVQKTLDLTQKLLMYYTGVLLERGYLSLVPPYLCALRQQLRSSLCAELLTAHTRRLTGLDPVSVDGAAAAEATSTGMADAECYMAFLALRDWFRRCTERQEQPPNVLASRLQTDIRPNELRIQLVTFALACQASQTYGPHQRARVARWLVYPHIAARQDAEAAAAAAAEAEGADAEAAVDQAAAAAARVDPVSYYDALDYANCLCCELALGDDVTAAAGHLLFEEVLPEDLETAVLAASDALAESAAVASTAAAEAAAAAGPDADVGPLPFLLRYRRHHHPEQQQQPGTSAATVLREAAEADRLAVQLRNQAAELSAWRLFFRLDAELARWMARHEALAGAGLEAAEEVQALVTDGGALLQAYLAELLQVGWQEGLSSAERALAAAAETPEGVFSVTLTAVTPPGSAAGVPSTGSGWGQPTASYPGMQAFPLLNLKLALQEGFQRAAATAAAELGAKVDVVVAEGPGEPPGHVTVTLTAPAEPQSWHALVNMVCGAVRGGLDGVPSLLLIGLNSDRATSLAVCRRCCIAQAILRCAGLRLSLVALGADAHSPATGPQLLEMLAAPGGTAHTLDGIGLLELLTQSQLQHVMNVEADTVVQHLRNKQQQQRMVWRR